jgi:hypothetical protein
MVQSIKLNITKDNLYDLLLNIDKKNCLEFENDKVKVEDN